MAKFNRRRFLNLGLPATLGLGSPRLYRGATQLAGALSGADSVQARATALSENLIRNGDFSAGSPGSLRDNWSVVCRNPALKPSFQLAPLLDARLEIVRNLFGSRAPKSGARIVSAQATRCLARCHWDIDQNVQ